MKLEGKGRGLVATRKVAAGDILLQETPLMVIDSEDKEVTVWFQIFLNNLCNRISISTGFK